MRDLFYTILLGIVEGLTEFLPISSTGHLIVVGGILQFPTPALAVSDPKAFRDTFEIFIQIGAILAVIVFYRRQLLQQAGQVISGQGLGRRFWLYVLAAVAPAAIIGFAFRNAIKAALFNPVVVACALILGGIVFLLLERRPKPVVNPQPVEQTTLRQAVIVGLAQMVALIPGVSRSGASIIGGMVAGLDRSAATAFSFYLAIPTLGMACLYEIVSALGDGYVKVAHLPYFLVGTAVSFVVALAVIGWLLRYVANNSFRVFGIYRIGVGLLILALAIFAPNILGG
jgi:undecaprenyl-diphosphatase